MLKRARLTDSVEEVVVEEKLETKRGFQVSEYSGNILLLDLDAGDSLGKGSSRDEFMIGILFCMNSILSNLY